MKESIHPNSHQVTVNCSGCSKTFHIMSTMNQSDMNVEVCSNCHSAYTGERKVLAAGAIDRFKEKFGADFLGE